MYVSVLYIGGAISNLYGMLAARHQACEDIKTKGIHGATRYAVFTSAQVFFLSIYLSLHYYVAKVYCEHF